MGFEETYDKQTQQDVSFTFSNDIHNNIFKLGKSESF